jgi:hypothetical protein
MSKHLRFLLRIKRHLFCSLPLLLFPWIDLRVYVKPGKSSFGGVIRANTRNDAGIAALSRMMRKKEFIVLRHKIL